MQDDPTPAMDKALVEDVARFEDEIDAWQSAMPWLEAIGAGLITDRLNVGITRYAIQGGGGIASLWEGTKLVATVTVLRDCMNFSIATRWEADAIARERAAALSAATPVIEARVREACAKVVDECAIYPVGNRWSSTTAAREDIAAAIRKG